MILSLTNSYLSGSFTNQLLLELNHIGPKLPVALFDLLVGIITIRVLSRLARLAMQITHVQVGLRGVLTGILETIMWLLLMVALLEELGFSGIIYWFTGSVVAIGLALSAGGSTLVSDIVAGLFLARDPDFNVGDELIVGELKTRGVVIGMDSRRIRLQDAKGVLHVVPNSLVERQEWVVVHSHREVSPLVRTAKRLGAAARRKSAAVARKRNPLRENDQ